MRKKHRVGRTLGCRFATSLVALTLVALSGAQVNAQSRGPEPPPKGLRVELRIGDGSRTEYRIGELVPFSLIVSATDHSKQRMMLPELCDTPDWYPITNPPSLLTLRDKNRDLSCNLSGPVFHTAQIDLAEKPWVKTLTLNRQYMLDTPGTYELRWSGEILGQSISSNVARLTLLPRDPAWEALQLTHISSTDCDALRYLGTPAAELEMARRYSPNDVCRFAFEPALLDAKDRGAVLSVLEAKITAPNESIDGYDLRTMATLAVYRAHPDWYVVETQGQWRSVVKEEEIRYARELLAAAPAKEPSIREQCISTLAALTDMPSDFREALKQLIPPPVEAEDKGCKLSAARQSRFAQNVTVRGSGFAPGEVLTVKRNFSKWGYVSSTTSAADGTWMFTMGTFAGPETLQVSGKDCTVSVTY